ncbi:hypothetical protein [Lutibacter sp.]|uniref:hypothetical protein n=1 Tax=Lutibacter sp. TaxID=1925666 RepID=UPI002732A336|nr:hypothetical protein [Lutibacter sp.]MDP3313380.1 hypothetical protein [Lutibacter sp.]
MKKEKKHSAQNNHQSKLGFTIPEDYFENFRVTLQQKINENILEDVHFEQLGYTVPKDYLKNISSKILEKTNKKELKIISLISRYKYVVSTVAASLLILLSINYFNPDFAFSTNRVAVDSAINSVQDNFSDEETISLLLEDDESVDASISNYVVESLIIEDALFLFPTLKDVTLTSLFVEGKKLDVYLDNQLIDDLLITNLN